MGNAPRAARNNGAILVSDKLLQFILLCMDHTLTIDGVTMHFIGEGKVGRRLAALAAESPEAQRTRIDARERLAQMANTVSIVAQQLGFVHSWFAGVLPNVPAGPLVVVKK